MDWALVVSGLALVLSFLAFFTTRREQVARFDLERDLSFEGRLAEWPSAFVLHGVDVGAAKQLGVSAEQIAYLILSINAMASYCAANGVEISHHLAQNEYRQRMFAQPHTRQVWAFARLCIPAETAEPIDRYLTDRLTPESEAGASLSGGHPPPRS